MSTLQDERVLFEAALLALFEGINTGSGGSGSEIPTTRLNIINFVKAKLDELIPEGEGVSFSLSTEPNVSDPYDLLINAHLDESTKDILLSAPLSVLVPLASDETDGVAVTDNTGYIVLDSTFLRLSSLKMAEWQREVTVAITTTDPLYKKQTNQFLRGGIAKPVAVLNWKVVGVALDTYEMRRIIEYYSVESSHAIDKLMFIPEQLAEDFIAVNPNLLPSLAWMCAAKILQIIHLSELAKLAMEQVSLSYNNLI